MPRITDFCSCIYVLGCKLSLVRLPVSDFGITPVDDITIGITCAAFCFHMVRMSFISSWYLFCFSVIILARFCVFGTAMSIRKLFFVFLLISYELYSMLPRICMPNICLAQNPVGVKLGEIHKAGLSLSWN